MDSVINFYNWCNNLANDDKRVWYPFLQELEVKAGVKKVYLLFGKCCLHFKIVIIYFFYNYNFNKFVSC